MKISRYFIYIIWFTLFGCSPIYTLQLHEEKVVEIKAIEDSTVLAIIAPYQNAIEAEMNEVLCISSVEMKKGKPESLLGNFVTDLCLEQYDSLADMCILNNGGLRSTLPKGKITRRDIYELMPFENELVIIELNREEVQKLYEYIAIYGEPFSGPVISVDTSGSTIGLMPKGFTEMEAELMMRFYRTNYIRRMREFGGIYYKDGLRECYPNGPLEHKPDSIGKDAVFTAEFIEYLTASVNPSIVRVLTSDYLANGGGGMEFFNGKEQVKVGIKLRDAIINYCLSQGTITSTLDHRIIFQKRMPEIFKAIYGDLWRIEENLLNGE